MLFNSFEFLLFLPVVFLLYWYVFRGRKWQNLLVVVASYVFYGWWDWRFLLLIALTSLCSYSSGLLIERLAASRHLRRVISTTNIVLNLSILGVFKYYNFFVENIDMLFVSLGYKLDWITLDIILPVGISFYTFQALSYTIDVYRGNIRPTRDIVEFFAYISFFPQLVAGPIERATNLLPQFQKPRQFCYAKAVDGCRQMLWGFFMKVVVADNCASIVNTIFKQCEDSSCLMLVTGAFLFTFQIYGDFAGYSNIAIGCSKLFGFSLMENFKTPYFSSSIPEFWRRWHISLNSWFRDYVYIPLGGNKKGRWRQIWNTFIVFGLSGLWHGANWTYIVWGLYHGGLTALYRKSSRAQSAIRHMVSVACTFVLVVLGWIVFRAESLSQAVDYCAGIYTLQHGKGVGELELSKFQMVSTFAFIGMLICMERFTSGDAHPLMLTTKSRFVRWSIYLILIMCMLIFPGKSETFIYFQF